VTIEIEAAVPFQECAEEHGPTLPSGAETYPAMTDDDPVVPHDRARLRSLACRGQEESSVPKGRPDLGFGIGCATGQQRALHIPG